MKQAWVTGASSGLGKALAEALLEQGWQVEGISRRATITHPGYNHHTLDLSQPGAAKSVNFRLNPAASEILLVNNAGTLGEINQVGKMDDSALEAGLVLNTVSPAVLMNRFLNQSSGFRGKITVLNISSGASLNPYDGWAMYCSSKAGLDMFGATAALERQLEGDKRTRIFSVAPGIIDTPMQAQIRDARKEEFSQIDKFISLHQEGKLADPVQTSGKLLEVLNRRDEFGQYRYDIRELE